MGNSADCFFGQLHGIDDRSGSRWCESRSGPPLGRRFQFAGSRPPIGTELGGGSFGYFSMGLLYFQYGWLREAATMGPFVFIVDGVQNLVLSISRSRSGSVAVGRFAVFWWKLNEDVGSFDRLAFGRSVLEMGMVAFAFSIRSRYRMRIEGSQRFTELKIGEGLLDGWFEVLNKEVIWAWSWWRYRKEKIYCSVWVYRWFRRKFRRFGLTTPVEGGLSFVLISIGDRKSDELGIIGWPDFVVSEVGEREVWSWGVECNVLEGINEVCMRYRWWFWKDKREGYRGNASRRWLWCFTRRSTAESKGRGKVTGVFMGNVNGRCMAQRGRVCTWFFLCENLGHTRWLVSRQVVQWGTFSWTCGVVGLAGGLRLTGGVQEGLLSKAALMGNQFGVKRCVSRGYFNGVKRGTLSNQSVMRKRGVLGSGFIRVKRGVLSYRSVTLKRCVLGSSHSVVFKRCVFGGRAIVMKRNVWEERWRATALWKKLIQGTCEAVNGLSEFRRWVYSWGVAVFESRFEGSRVSGFSLMMPVEGGLSLGLSSVGDQKLDGFGIVGWLDFVVSDFGEVEVRAWWMERNGSEGIKGVWISYRWWFWKDKRKGSRGKASRLWLWCFSRRSTAESKGMGKVIGVFMGFHGCCMLRRERAGTWYASCGKLGPTRWLRSGYVVRWGTFPWTCGVTELAGGPRLTYGAHGGLLLKVALMPGSMRVKRCVLKPALDGVKRCVLKPVIAKMECVERRFLQEEILVMADEVANLMNNLRFSEEELVEMEGMESQCKEQQCDTEKWVVAKLFTMRKVDGAAVLRVFGSMGVQISNSFGVSVAVDLRTGEGSMGSFLRFRSTIDCAKPLKSKPAGEEGPYQFGEWLRVPLAQKKSTFQGGKKQGVVYTARGTGETGRSSGRGKNLEMLQQADGGGEGRGQQVNFAQLRPRGPKRVLQGKYEVCTPVGPKMARSASSSQRIEVEGGSEVVSPLKTSITVEAAAQPRREP
ncbi:hypothetical protein V6N13_040385 [Hibiscus sabdariffa]